MGAMTTTNWERLISVSLPITGRWYHVTDKNSDDREKKKLMYIILPIFSENID